MVHQHHPPLFPLPGLRPSPGNHLDSPLFLNQAQKRAAQLLPRNPSNARRGTRPRGRPPARTPSSRAPPSLAADASPHVITQHRPDVSNSPSIGQRHRPAWPLVVVTARSRLLLPRPPIKGAPARSPPPHYPSPPSQLSHRVLRSSAPLLLAGEKPPPVVTAWVTGTSSDAPSLPPPPL
nr:proline-rich receptor-like protein kinase PERK8 [Lolium perenne]